MWCRLSKKPEVIASIILVAFVFIPYIAKSGNIYKWIDDNGVVHYSDSPILKTPKSNIVIIEENSSTKASVIRVPDLGFTIQDIKMCWYLSVNALQKEAIYHPQISFIIKNEFNKPLKHLFIKALYITENRQIFGKAIEYVEEIPGSYLSQTIFMRPAMGFIYNGYNADTIMRQTFTIKLFASLGGKEMSIGSLYFQSHKACY